MEPCGTSTFNCGTFMWNLVEPQFLTVEPLSGALWNLNFWQWNLYVEPCGTSTFDSGTFMWNLVEPQRLTVEPLCGTLWNFNFWPWNLYVEPCGTWTFNCGTFMWNLVEPELFTVEPVGRTSRNRVQGFGLLPHAPRSFIGRPPSFSGCWEFQMITIW